MIKFKKGFSLKIISISIIISLLPTGMLYAYPIFSKDGLRIPMNGYRRVKQAIGQTADDKNIQVYNTRVIIGETKKIPTKILLVNVVDTGKLDPTYPISIYTLKDYMDKTYPDNCTVEILDTQLNSIGDIVKFAKEWQPQILGLSVKTENTAVLDKFMGQINASIPKAERPLCVIGKQVATFGYRDLLERYPDAICVRGEGELALGGLSEYVQGKRSLRDVGNIAYKNRDAVVETERVLLHNLDSIGPTNHSDLEKYVKLGANFWMEASRGCPWGLCSFCSISEFWGRARPPRREKSVDAIITELKEFAAMGIERFTFSDE